MASPPVSPRGGGEAAKQRKSMYGFGNLAKKASSKYHHTAEEELENSLARSLSHDKGGSSKKLNGLLSKLLPTQQNRNEGSASVYKNKRTIVNKDVKSADEWKKILKKPQYVCLVDRKMEPEDSVKKNYINIQSQDPKAVFFYFCVACGTPVFCSKDRVEDENTYLTFTDGLPGAVQNIAGSFGNVLRVEAQCAGCGGFLGEYTTMHYKNRRVKVNTHSLVVKPVLDTDMNKIFAK